MPLTKKGKEVLKAFRHEYGKEGDDFFYAFMHKHPGKTEKFHLTDSYLRRKPLNKNAKRRI